MRGWWGSDDSDDEPDDEVRERFVRVVGLREVDDDEPDIATALKAAPDIARAEPRAPALTLRAFHPRRRGVRALALVAAVVVVIAAVIAWRSRPAVEPVAAHTDVVISPLAVPASSGYIVVAVAGKVQRPGLVRLPSGSRVADAIEAAGGVLPGTDLSLVNIARKLADGELVVIGETPPPDVGGGAGAGGQGAPGGLVNLNTATLAQLDGLPGVGPVLAQRIVDYRTKHGGFRTIDELRQVDGVGDAKFAQLKELVTV
jgi:competence protein ComEA